MIVSGTCDVINPYDNFLVHQLQSGDFFGAADLLGICEIEYFGNIFAGENGCVIKIIEKPDQVIQLFERKNLQMKMRGQYDALKIMLQHKYFPRHRNEKGVFTDY